MASPLIPVAAPRTIPPSQLIDPMRQALNSIAIADGVLNINLNTTTAAVSVGRHVEAHLVPKSPSLLMWMQPSAAFADSDEPPEG